MDIYTPLNLMGTKYTAKQWIRSRMGLQAEECGKVCIVRDKGVAVKAVTLFVDPTKLEVLPDCFMEVMRDWRCCWIRKTLRLVDSEDWTKRPIE
jgi:hypothetical protein